MWASTPRSCVTLPAEREREKESVSGRGKKGRETVLQAAIANAAAASSSSTVMMAASKQCMRVCVWQSKSKSAESAPLWCLLEIEIAAWLTYTQTAASALTQRWRRRWQHRHGHEHGTCDVGVGRSIKKERIKASQQANAPPELPLKVFGVICSPYTDIHTHTESGRLGAQGRMCCGCGYPAAAVVVAAAASALCLPLGGHGRCCCCCCCCSCCPCWWCAFCSATHTHTHAHVPTDLCPLTEHGLYLQDFFTISGLADWLVGWLAGCWSGLALLLLLLCLCLWSGHISLFSCCHGFMINLNLNLESYIETLTSSSLPLPSPSEQLSFRHPSPPPSPLPSPAWSYVVLLGLL